MRDLVPYKAGVHKVAKSQSRKVKRSRAGLGDSWTLRLFDQGWGPGGEVMGRHEP